MANLPYNVAVPVVLHLLETLPTLRTRAGDGAGRGGRPARRRARLADLRRAEREGGLVRDATRAGAVPRAVFWPVPNVDSGLVRLVRREPPATTATRAEVFAAIDAAFAQRRKTLRAALAGWAGSPTAAEEALRAAGIDPRARGETLTVAGSRGSPNGSDRFPLVRRFEAPKRLNQRGRRLRSGRRTGS